MEYELEVRLVHYKDSTGGDPWPEEDVVAHRVVGVSSTTDLTHALEELALELTERRDVYEEKVRATCEHERTYTDLAGEIHCPDCGLSRSSQSDPSDAVKAGKEQE